MGARDVHRAANGAANGVESHDEPPGQNTREDTREDTRGHLRTGPAHGRDLSQADKAGRATAARRVAAWAVLVPVILLAFTLTLSLVYSVVMPPSTPMLARWLTGRSVSREVVPLDAISPALVKAVFAAEDQKFCMHRGIDWDALHEVVEEENGPSRGASTITMQTVKNVFLWRGRSYVRKAIELPLAFLVDLIWGKRRTMEIYLNVAEWGEGIFGAEAAARHWFGKSARDLKPREAELLAASLPNPLERNPRKPSSETLAKAGRIRSAMAYVDDYIGCLPTR